MSFNKLSTSFVILVGLVLILETRSVSSGMWGFGEKKADTSKQEMPEQATSKNSPRRNFQPEINPPQEHSKRPGLDTIRQAVTHLEHIQGQYGSKINNLRRPQFFDGVDAVQGAGQQDKDIIQGTFGKLYQSDYLRPDYQDDYSKSEDDVDFDDNNMNSSLDQKYRTKGLKYELNTKFVSTHKDHSQKPIEEALDLIKQAKGTQWQENSTNAKTPWMQKNKIVSSSYWSKQLDKAYKKTKKGLNKGAKAIGEGAKALSESAKEIPKYVEQATDSLQAFLKLDSKGKLLAFINEVEKDARFVRHEYSQFTLSWSPIMEEGLNYLGSKNLDKITWVNNDDLDFRRDALHSLAFGYEFMRAMIIWRQNLLIAHEAFRLWLYAKKKEIENQHLTLNETDFFQLESTRSYMLLRSWEVINIQMAEARKKLDHLMDIENDRPKNYESDYFRNILVLQEMYVPTIEEFDSQCQQVNNAISTSGVVVEDLESAVTYFEMFRKRITNNELDFIDWDVPEDMKAFLKMLEPQLRASTLVYSKSFLRGLSLL